LFRRIYALPSEHGSWVFLLSPLLIGLFSADRFTVDSFFLVITLLAAFLIRQPVTVGVKAYSGRRPRSDLTPARFWTLIYGVFIIGGSIWLLLHHHLNLLILGIPGVVIFTWHLYLVSKRQERRQAGVEILGSGVLALSAPAAYWIGRGDTDPIGWLLFFLTWFQSAASIVYAYLRLEQRELKETPAPVVRLRMAYRALFYTTFNLTAVIILALSRITPELLFIPYTVQWLETIYGTFFPAINVKPTSIGIRQLLISSLFTLLFVIIWH
jgi:hypothetical protein